MLFPSISMAVIGYTCITSVCQSSKPYKAAIQMDLSSLLWFLTLFYSPGYIRYSVNTIKRS